MTELSRRAPAKAAPIATLAERSTEKVGKTQIVDLMAERGLNRKQAATVFATVLEVVAEAIRGGKAVWACPALEPSP